jgi:putative transposase
MFRNHHLYYCLSPLVFCLAYRLKAEEAPRDVGEKQQVAQTIRKTCKYKLKPTPDQERTFQLVLSRCRALYNAALEQRKTWWERGQGKRATLYRQRAELPDLKAACPEYDKVNAQVLQDVMLRVDRTFEAFFQRICEGGTPGYPRFQGQGRYTSFTFPLVGEHGGARLDNGLLILSKIGRVAVRWSRPLQGTPKTITIKQEADGWYACFSCADIPIQPLPSTGQEVGIDLGIEAFATRADGARIFHSGWYHKAERSLKTAQRRVSRRMKGSNRRRKAVKLLAKAHLKVKRQRADFHHKTARALVRANDTIYHEGLQTANMVKTTISPRVLLTRGGRNS